MATKKQFNSFEEMLAESDVPVLVDFYAAWCGPCQMMSKILEQVNAHLNQRIKIVKIDTEKYPELATDYHVYALPTLVFFKEGKPIDRIEGVLPTEALTERLQAFL
jgi:protein disulfide-isomerase